MVADIEVDRSDTGKRAREVGIQKMRLRKKGKRKRKRSRMTKKKEGKEGKVEIKKQAKK